MERCEYCGKIVEFVLDKDTGELYCPLCGFYKDDTDSEEHDN